MEVSRIARLSSLSSSLSLSPPPAWILSLEEQWRLRDADTRHKDEKQIGKGEGEGGKGGRENGR